VHVLRKPRQTLHPTINAATVYALEGSQVDYCNSLFWGKFDYCNSMLFVVMVRKINRLKRIQDNAAKVALIPSWLAWCRTTPVAEATLAHSYLNESTAVVLLTQTALSLVMTALSLLMLKKCYRRIRSGRPIGWSYYMYSSLLYVKFIYIVCLLVFLSVNAHGCPLWARLVPCMQSHKRYAFS